jgi:hypothetical protein
VTVKAVETGWRNANRIRSVLLIERQQVAGVICDSARFGTDFQEDP